MMQVRELMKTGVVSLDPDDPVGRARQLMLGLRHHGLPVVDRVGAVIGIVTASDLVEEWPFGEPVETIMSRPVLTVDASAPASEAARLMLAERIHHLVVVERSRPVGILSSFDLLSAVVEHV